MPSSNPFVRIANRYEDRPQHLQPPLITQAVGQVIPFVNTAGCFIEAYTNTHVAVRLDNRTEVQNHLGGLHAAAMALLAETASGLVVALNVPPSSAPLLRTMDVSFDRFARHPVQAEAYLTDETAETIQSRPIGRVDVDVRLRAPSNDETLVSSQLEWAWLPEDRLPDTD